MARKSRISEGANERPRSSERDRNRSTFNLASNKGASESPQLQLNALKLGTARSSPALSAGLRPALRVRGFWDASRPDSSLRLLRAERVIIFDCCQLQSCTAKWLRREWGSSGRPESPSTEDVCLRCWLNSDSPDGNGEARHGGCCHRTLVRARARDETRRRIADSFEI